jgi:Glycosyl transferases group 1
MELNLPTSIYINSSLQEGQCIAVYDAALLGNALCLPDISSFRGILDDNYLTHAVKYYEKLAENIIWYIEHREERESHIQANREWIHAHHNYEFINKRIQEEFNLL